MKNPNVTQMKSEKISERILMLVLHRLHPDDTLVMDGIVPAIGKATW